MGEITACNVTNDIFAMNVPEISGILIFLAIKTDTPIEIAEGILKGIKFFMEKKINSKVLGGHTIYCEWPLMGGEASGFINKEKIIQKRGVKAGDKLILTKPIGIQGVMAAYRILKDMPEILETYSIKELKESIELAIKVMTTPNQGVVKVIHSYDDFSFIHAMSDITGFGLAGHAKEMIMDVALSIIIERVPYIKLAKELSDELGYAFSECECHETAGGMLLSVQSERAEEFSNALNSAGISNWIVGTITRDFHGVVKIDENAELLEIDKI